MTLPTTREEQFDDDLKTSRRFEVSLVWRELVALGLVAALVVARQLWFL